VVERPVALDFDRLNTASVILFGVTAAEPAFLVAVTPAFDFADWVYVLQHVIVLAVAFAGRRPTAQDHSPGTGAAVVVAYGYPCAQAIPMYLSCVLADIGYNLGEWDAGTVLLVLAGWASLIYRIDREERILAHDGRWADYARSVRYRMLPGIWQLRSA
jgi:protein-S-isoprenylcysteine O-methyltransferase Ste14